MGAADSLLVPRQLLLFLLVGPLWRHRRRVRGNRYRQVGGGMQQLLQEQGRPLQTVVLGAVELHLRGGRCGQDGWLGGTLLLQRGGSVRSTCCSGAGPVDGQAVMGL